MGCFGWFFRVAAKAVVWTLFSKIMARFLRRR